MQEFEALVWASRDLCTQITAYFSGILTWYSLATAFLTIHLDFVGMLEPYTSEADVHKVQSNIERLKRVCLVAACFESCSTSGSGDPNKLVDDMKSILLQFNLIYEDLKGAFETHKLLKSDSKLRTIDEDITVLIADVNE